MATTLGETAAAVTAQLGADGSAWTTGADEVVALVPTWAAGDAMLSPRVTAYVPALDRIPASAAMATSSATLRALAGRAVPVPERLKALGRSSSGVCGSTGGYAGYRGCYCVRSYHSVAVPSGAPSSGCGNWRGCCVIEISFGGLAGSTQHREPSAMLGVDWEFAVAHDWAPAPWWAPDVPGELDEQRLASGLCAVVLPGRGQTPRSAGTSPAATASASRW